jgi:hypothetical protein
VLLQNNHRLICDPIGAQSVSGTIPNRLGTICCRNVARTLVSAASRLVSTLFRACDTESKPGLGVSAGAACKHMSVKFSATRVLREDKRNGALREVERKIEAGLASARRGEMLDGDVIMRELRGLSAKRRPAGNAPR